LCTRGLFNRGEMIKIVESEREGTNVGLETLRLAVNDVNAR
jgi:hypothetical protein